MRARIAAAAARLMAEDGIDDFALAKRKAARGLGAADTEALPGNDEIEAELRAYLALYQADEHPERVAELRGLALEAMRALERFNPYLTGPVLAGTAGPYAEIELQLFPESTKEVELFLLDRNIAYDASDERRYSGRSRARRGGDFARLAGRAAALVGVRPARRALGAEDLAGRPGHGARRDRGSARPGRSQAGRSGG